ncbi:DNA (cytosine-5-)-methyltransferase [Campylobacter sp.]|uniref:DNA (cytosine-5-)-methyltransferase n=1 Tax=Campylobacter sp. TaxID=205 RepID=UPI002A80C55B|nr:DNA (cytosine-5-)-methyltransferase [Campylobacter sp.]
MKLIKTQLSYILLFFNDERNFGDVTKIEAEKLPDFDILVGGFPCQAFSVAGKRLGFEDTRGTIFFDFARILKAKKPTFGIFENVRGLLNHERGRTFETIIKTLDEIGYDAQWGIINTRFHGLPQNRERVYIVANLRERSATKILFERGNGGEDKMERGLDILGNYRTKSGKTHQRMEIHAESGVMSCLTATDYKWPRMVKVGDIDGVNTQYSRVYDSKGVSTTINAGGGGLGAKTGLYKVGEYPLFYGNLVRRLTPKECFRLQGFSDDMVELGYKTQLSDTALYKAAGNAVSVPVVEWVAGRVLSWDNLRDASELGSDYLF